MSINCCNMSINRFNEQPILLLKNTSFCDNYAGNKNVCSVISLLLKLVGRGQTLQVSYSVWENCWLFQELADVFQPSLSASCLPQAATYRLVFGLHSSENKLFIWSFLIILTLSALQLSSCCSSSLNTVLPWDCIFLMAISCLSLWRRRKCLYEA